MFALLRAWVKLGRFLFLAGGFVMYGLGLVIAAYDGAAINWRAAALGQLVVTAAQLMTHYGNDYFDFEADRHNQTPTAWSGGSRVLQAGLLPRRAALVTALIFGVLALTGLALLAILDQPGWLPVLLAFLAIALAWEYSAPPLTLHSRGLGEFSTVLVVSILTPVFSATVQHISINGPGTLFPLVGLMPVACLQFAMLVAVHLPDVEGDIAVGKRTLVVRLGQPRATRLAMLTLAGAFGLMWTLAALGLPSLVSVIFSLNSLMAIRQIWHLLRGDRADLVQSNTVAFLGVAILFCGAALQLLSYVLLILLR